MSSGAGTNEQNHSLGALSRGTNQVGVRLYNERLILSLIRRFSSLPKADLARMTGLSPQTISIIANRLSDDGLLLRGNPTRGRVGQPSVPYSVNPEGAYFLGLKIGRRTSDVVLMDFAGRVLSSIHEPHPWPTAAGTVDLVRRGINELIPALDRRQRSRVNGIGIASPFELWNWRAQIAAPPEVLEDWRHVDIQKDVAGISPWPVYFHNDGTAACAAELVLGSAAHGDDFLYFFVGSFIGGGVVLNGHLYPGRSGYAGAVGPLPVPTGDGGFQQLLTSASIYVLAERLTAAGRDPAVLWRDPSGWGDLGEPLDSWIRDSARDLAIAVVSAVSVIDFFSIIIDGAFPAEVRRRLVEQVRRNVTEFDRQGLTAFDILEGSIGHQAREIGGACLPLLANFTQDREVLFKDIVEPAAARGQR